MLHCVSEQPHVRVGALTSPPTPRRVAKLCKISSTVGLPTGRATQYLGGVATGHLSGKFGSPCARGRRSRLYSVGWQRSVRPTIGSGPFCHHCERVQPIQIHCRIPWLSDVLNAHLGSFCPHDTSPANPVSSNTHPLISYAAPRLLLAH